MKKLQDLHLQNAIVSTGSDITEKVKIKEGISKTARMYLAKDILCVMLTFDTVESSRSLIDRSYAIADILIEKGEL